MKYNTPVFKKDIPDDSYKVRPLPPPTGTYPYHLKLLGSNSIVPDKMTFHMVGDTGNLNRNIYRQPVASAMAKQCKLINETTEYPCFLFHLGDLVYSHGEAQHYAHQFFSHFAEYPGKVFAIAGNHDADINPDSTTAYQSLDAFRAVFCDTEERQIAFGGNGQRKSQTQPNVYWVLQTPLANIIGLYSNVPKFGWIDDEQKAWFIEQLKWANGERPGKALIVCVHHAPYSADVNHGSSKLMIEFLDGAFSAAGVLPDAVFSGHVHSYERFSKVYPNGKKVPFIVAGAGGFDELHSVAGTEDPRFTNESDLFTNVTLAVHCGNKHGFLKITIEKVDTGVKLEGNYYTVEQGETTLADTFYVSI
ncbi:MAG: metallophosphoesterase [Sphingobacteriaceae bacterium]|nr:MAG: metallophosphoesterase [Sphingobacteriaceae bacterium]